MIHTNCQSNLEKMIVLKYMDISQTTTVTVVLSTVE